jgi:alpha-L-rhamnosidase
MFLAGLLLLCGAWRYADASLTPCNLRCDGMERPLGVDDARPCLGWQLSAGEGRGRRMTAYRILVAASPRALNADRGGLWDSGKVRAGRLPYAVYGGKPLHARQRIYWKVKIWDERDVASTYSAPQTWEMGLLTPNDWSARWITGERRVPDAEAALFAEDPAPLLRREFEVRKPVAGARIYVCGLGYYELHLNSVKVGDHVLDPGWTDYARRALYVTYDITAQLHPGRNAVGVMLGNGWYNPLPLRMWGHLNLREHLTIGQPRVIAQIEIRYRDGTRQRVATDATWRCHDGPILKNSVYLGEVYDARRELPGWDRPGRHEMWAQARLAAAPVGGLCAQTAPPIRITAILRPVKITRPTPDSAIFDMGRNFAGWVRLRVRGAAGTRIVLRYGELLNPDGTLNPMTSVAGQIKGARVEPGSAAPATAWQSDTYILRGNGPETWTPRFTFHGFRYVEVAGLPERPTLDTLTGLRLNADVEPVGIFTCSDKRFNRIQEMVRWTELSNLFSVQSDCPHREKFGYGGDVVAVAEMAMFNFDMSRLYAKTVQDYVDAQRPNGGFTETAPYVGIADAGLGGESGPVEWGTVQPLLLRHLYRYYGDRRLIERHYAATQRWIRLLQTKANSDILDNGIGDHEALVRPSTALTGTAFYYANAVLMSELADILGRSAEAGEDRRRAERIRAAFQDRFDPQRTGRFEAGGEGCQAFALYFGLVPPQERDAALSLLIHDVMETNRGHLDTGIFGTKFLLSALTTANRADVAFTLADQQTFPGWGFMLANGATTLWEHWEFSDNTFSHNHPMFGSVSEWFFRALAGIAPAPDAVGFDRILIHPHPVAGLTRARGAYRSVRGLVVSDWEQRSDGFHLTVTVPPNASAQVTLPAQRWQRITESGNPIASAFGVTLIGKHGEEAILQIGSGTYRFQVVYSRK